MRTSSHRSLLLRRILHEDQRTPLTYIANMIIHGIKERHLATCQAPSPCAHCGTEHAVELDVFQSYAHLFWIPFFPVRRTVQSECSHCQQALAGKFMDPVNQVLGKELKSSSRTPIWMFSGVLLLGVLIPWAFWQSDRFDTELRAKLRAPEVNDVQLSDREYTLYKVVAVRNDSVEVQLSDLETNKRKGVYRLHEEGDAGYGEERAIYSFQDLQELRDKDVIFDVTR